MAFEQRDNQGALFKNEDRVTDNQPNARGRCKIDGRDYFVAAWTKVSAGGVKYQSLAFTPAPDSSSGSAGGAERKGRSDPAFDDDIPF